MPLLDRDNQSIARLQKLRFNKASVVGGSGARLILEDGCSVIDLSAGWGSAILGYGHPAIKRALAKTAESPAGTGLISLVSEPAVLLAERLLALTPAAGERRVWFGHSASDANEAMVRALKAATGRTMFISFAGSWHGGTVGSMGVSGHPALDAHARSEGLHLVPYPNAYRDLRIMTIIFFCSLMHGLNSTAKTMPPSLLNPSRVMAACMCHRRDFCGAL
jgi:4-aminobutyrate aminotransferase